MSMAGRYADIVGSSFSAMGRALLAAKRQYAMFIILTIQRQQATANNPPPATTAFARSRLPRSLLNAHCAVADGGLAGFKDANSGFECCDCYSNKRVLI